MTYGASSAVQCWQEDALDMTVTLARLWDAHAVSESERVR